MKTFTVTVLLIIFAFIYFDLFTSLINAKDTIVNIIGLCTIPLYVYINKKIINRLKILNKFNRINKNKTEKNNEKSN